MNMLSSTPSGQAAQNEFNAALTAGAGMAAPRKNPDQDGTAYAVVPEGWKLEELPERVMPKRPIGTAMLRDAASFIRYFNDHKVTRSRIYASMEPALFLALLDDFDGADNGQNDIALQTDWRQFRALFKVPASREWTLWNASNRQVMGQLKFAEFLQDNLPDVITPDGTALLEMALNFEASQSGSFIATQRMQDGSHNLTWKAENNAAGTVKLPEQIVLSIPVFENEEPAEVHARLRYRVKDGALSIWYELIRPHKVLEAAFRATWQRIATETSGIILLGSPE